MMAGSFLSITDQVAEHLRAEILRGRWSGAMPGKHQLAAELGINNKTVEAALRQLENGGLLIPQGAGRKRLIAPRRRKSSRALRIAFFLNEGILDLKSELLIRLTQALTGAGHTVVQADKSLSALRFNVKRIAGVVRQTKADAWIIFAGSREVLEWFAGQPVPAFALFGNRTGLDIAAVGPDKFAALAAATRQLIELGHRRIVLLCRKLRRLPQPGLSETLFLETLRGYGCPVGEYNLPDWEDSDLGFQECLRSLFGVTPPTALIVDEAHYFVATMQFLLTRGIRVPQQVSLICTDDDPAFSHCSPPIARMTYDPGPVVRRIVNWAANVSRGKRDLRQSFTPSQFLPGGTIARAQTQPD